MKKRKADRDDEPGACSSASVKKLKMASDAGAAVAAGEEQGGDQHKKVQPVLSTELIAKVSSFANYGSDLMNICLAVGRKDSGVIRYACLRNNLRYLEHPLQNICANIGSLSAKEFLFIRTCFLTWMEVNSDWRKLCTADRVDDDRYRNASVKDERSGEVTFCGDPLILFNNPAVAIECGLFDVLKHLVEVVGIDINGYKWSGYTTGGVRGHLFAAACTVLDDIGESCFNYLLSRPDLDVCSPSGNGSDQAWEALFPMDLAGFRSGQETFEAIIQHDSFDVNGRDKFGTLHLCTVLGWCVGQFEEDLLTTSILNTRAARFKCLLEAGADPELGAFNEDGRSVLTVARALLDSQDEETEPWKICKKLVEMMEEAVAKKATGGNGVGN